MSDELIFATDTARGHYEIHDLNYEGRRARVLYSGQRQAAQSGVALDGQPDLLFDYNQRLRELANYVRPEKLLLIGGGAFTLPLALQTDLPDLELTVVEYDPELEPLARQYFDWQPGPRTRVVHADGRDYLAQSSEQFDLILVDAFSHDTIPTTLVEPAAVQALRQHLAPGGLLAYNVIAAYYGRRASVLHELAATAEERFKTVEVFPASLRVSLWLPQNFVLVAQMKTQPGIKTALRFAPIEAGQPFDVRRDLSV
jgi:spermidine synthase